MLPYVEVSHLPSSASFYAAVTHPLGLRYISANPASIVYGTTSPNDPATNSTTTTTSTTLAVFEVRHPTGDRAGQPKPSRLVLSASSPSTVSAFHAAALRANPDLPLIGGGSGESHFLRHPSPGGGEETRAKITDFDGNIMEVVYLPPQDYASRHGGSTVRRTQSTTDEVSRILDWNLDVATSHPAQSVAGSGAVGGSATALARRPAPMPFDDPHPPTVLRRSVTTSTLETSSSRPHSNGLSTGTIGTILGAVATGAAIGGALTYMSMRNDRERAPRQEFDAPPAFQRRSTFPDPYPDLKPRYVEVERTVEKIHYPHEYPPIAKSRYYPPPSHVARYSLGGGSRSREVEEIDDRASRHSTRQSTSGRTRTRSETVSTRRPMMIAETEYRSNSGSKYTTTAAPKMLTEAEHRSRVGSKHSANLLPEADHWSRAPSKHSTPRSVRHHEPAAETYVSVPRSARHYEPEAQSYASARSKRSESTIRPAPPPVTYQETAIRSRAPSKVPTQAPSRHSTATAMMMPSLSRTTSHASARMVPLPDSRVGSSHANWDDDHDNDSIAPSDSISCIGSRSRGGRSYH